MSLREDDRNREAEEETKDNLRPAKMYTHKINREEKR
jgi:hypothetical protein